jgi:hypothetical protein
MDFEMYKMDAPVSGNDFGWGVYEHLTHHGNKTDLRQQNKQFEQRAINPSSAGLVVAAPFRHNYRDTSPE